MSVAPSAACAQQANKAKIARILERNQYILQPNFNQNSALGEIVPVENKVRTHVSTKPHLIGVLMKNSSTRLLRQSLSLSTAVAAISFFFDRRRRKSGERERKNEWRQSIIYR